MVLSAPARLSTALVPSASPVCTGVNTTNPDGTTTTTKTCELWARRGSVTLFGTTAANVWSYTSTATGLSVTVPLPSVRATVEPR